MYLDHQSGHSSENDEGDDGNDQSIINPIMIAMHQQQSFEDLQSSHCKGTSTCCQLMALMTEAGSPRMPAAHSQAKKCAIDDLECIMSFSSSSNFIVSAAPLCSTFELPKRVYGDAKGLQSIQWDLAEDTGHELKTHAELIAELCKTCSEFRTARECVTSVVVAIDATNAQLALSVRIVASQRDILSTISKCHSIS
jgi:hypothetical protein